MFSSSLGTLGFLSNMSAPEATVLFLLGSVAQYAIGFFVLYWVIRLAVRAAIRDTSSASLPNRSGQPTDR